MRLPIRIWQGVTPFNLNAVDFNGSDEYMANTTTQVIGVTTSFTIDFFIKPTAHTTFGTIVHIDSNTWAADDSEIFIALDSSTAKIYAKVVSTDASANKQYYWNTVLSNGTKYHVAVTYDGTNFNIYINGVADTPYNKAVDNAVTLHAVNRMVHVAMASDNTSNPFNWQLACMRIWNTNLSSTELLALTDSWNGYQRDVRNAFWNYTSTSALIHQWVPWKDGTSTSTMGTDYVSSGTINIGTNAANITSADIVTF